MISTLLASVLGVDEVAQLLGCKRRQVFYLLKSGVLERAPRYGRQVRIYTESVERALAPPPVRGRKRRTAAAPEAVKYKGRAALRGEAEL